MNFDNKAWLTLYDNSFKTDDYIYHYTSMEKAVLILYGDSLKFSKINSTNDTLEAKPKMSYQEIIATEQRRKVFKQIQEINNNYIQLLCFSKDNSNIDNSIVLDDPSTDTKLNDYSGRGFALPRMWAQYSNNNNGVCFIFNKKLIEKQIKKQLNHSLIKSGDVEYVSQYKKLDMDYDSLEELLVDNVIQKSINYVDYLKNNLAFTNYNYFYKLNDWKNENEYRCIAYGNNEFYVHNIKSAIIGVIIGEQIEPSDEKILKYFVGDLCEIKKISFSYNGCLLTNIYND